MNNISNHVAERFGSTHQFTSVHFGEVFEPDYAAGISCSQTWREELHATVQEKTW